MDQHTGHVRKLIESRGSLVEVSVLAIALALAINLVSTAVSDYLGPSRIWLTLAIGATLIAFSVVYLVARLLGKRKANIELTGVYVVDTSKREILKIPLYEYSEDLKRYLQSAFAENRALKSAWDEGIQKDRVNDGESKAVKLLNEATEYFLLNELSLHLSSYFNGIDHSDRLVEISRNDIPSVLLSNRFLELFSRPMEDRPAFCDDIGNLPAGSKVVAQFSSKGMFSEFDLTLPKKSEVTRTKEGSVQIETPRFILRLQCDVTRWGHNLPRGVEEFVLGNSGLGRISPRRVDVRIDVTFKFGALVTPTGWDDYKWVDSFEKELTEKFSIDAFFERHGWAFAQTMLLMLRNKERPIRRNASEGSTEREN